MTWLGWSMLYKAFAGFAHEARRYRFYLKEIDDMEESLFEMCPYPRSYRKNIAEKASRKDGKA